MPCAACEERRRLMLEKIAAVKAAAQVKLQAVLAAIKAQDKQQQS